METNIKERKRPIRENYDGNSNSKGEPPLPKPTPRPVRDSGNDRGKR